MSDKIIMTEWYELDLSPDLIKEAKDSGGPLIIRDRLLQRADTKNHNGRVYPMNLMTREVNKYSKLVNERRALGELDHPDSPIVELKNVSHLVTHIYMKNDEVRGDLEILNTPPGKVLAGIVEQGVKIGVSSRGVGSLKRVNGENIVQNDFELIAFDAVSSPSTPGAFLVENYQRESLDKHTNLRNILHGILGDSYFN
jgi:hypothetical protein